MNSALKRPRGIGCLVAAATGMLLSACANDPYTVAAPREAKEYVHENMFDPREKPRDYPWDPIRKTQPVSLCYSSQLNTPEQVQAAAEEFCKGGSVVFYGEDTFWNGCGLFQPQRATFICRPGKPQGATN